MIIKKAWRGRTASTTVSRMRYYRSLPYLVRVRGERNKVSYFCSVFSTL